MMICDLIKHLCDNDHVYRYPFAFMSIWTQDIDYVALVQFKIGSRDISPIM